MNDDRCQGLMLGRLLVLALASCGYSHSGDSRVTARVVSAGNGQVCVEPEGAKDAVTGGCYPITEKDAQRVRVGACVDARFPYPNDGTRAMYDVTVLDRACAS